jgi:transposase
MVAERFAMRKIKEVLRLAYECGVEGSRTIGQSVDCSKSNVNNILNKATAAGLKEWTDVAALSEAELEAKLYPRPTSGAAQVHILTKPMPDWALIHQELHRADHQMTLALLWTEYKAQHSDGYQYSRFSELYRRWLGTVTRVMRQEHRGGEKAFVDYCDGLELTDAVSGKKTKTQLFVGALGASSYTFAMASASQKIGDWIASHCRMYEYFGGVPSITVPDNLRSGVNKPDRYEAEPNSTYQEMATHYGTCIIPARVRKPRDKAKAEAAVLVAQRWILAVLRHRTFYSLAEMNEAIAELLEKLNDRKMKHFDKSRRELWELLDRPALKALPIRRYEFATWKKVRLNIDYHVDYERHYYSAPHTLAKEELWVRVTNWVVEVFHKGRRVASHTRSYAPYKMTTIAEHMPSSHRAHAEWTPTRMIEWGQTIGTNTGRLVEQVLARMPHPEQGFRSVRGIIRLAKEHGNGRLEMAAAKSLSIGSTSYQGVKRMLKNHMEGTSVEIAAPVRGIVIQDNECTARQTDLLAAENLRGKDYYR